MSQINVTTIRNRTGGPPNLDQGVIVGAAATFSGDVNVSGTLTYEDVTNVDAVGIITAREGIRIGAGKSIGSDGADVVYYGDGSNLSGVSGWTQQDAWLYGGG